MNNMMKVMMMKVMMMKVMLLAWEEMMVMI
jgi:hypothetical protein